MDEILQHIPLWILLPTLIWDIIWKMIALWKSARNNHLVWFIFIGITGTVGILPLIYLLICHNRRLKYDTSKSGDRR
ncbi:MAG: DUF5652 family protein [Dysgonamonadaceae bacterium]|jgi:hypothetical protein|nr:DUF5652 family protein [Dysgonamonadaceae bacterium]